MAGEAEALVVVWPCKAFQEATWKLQHLYSQSRGGIFTATVLGFIQGENRAGAGKNPVPVPRVNMLSLKVCTAHVHSQSNTLCMCGSSQTRRSSPAVTQPFRKEGNMIISGEARLFSLEYIRVCLPCLCIPGVK